MKRIGIYGGTFNPPHIGHIEAAKRAAEAFELSELMLVPSRIAPHKELPSGSATPEQRLQMLQIAAKNIPGVTVSDIELRRNGVSYTWQTLEQLKTENPDAELVLCMGTDMFLTVDQWVQGEKILQLAEIGVFCRGDRGESKAIAIQRERLTAMGARVSLAENPPITVSSTDLRRMLAFQCADSLLLPGVGDFIRENGLYDSCADFRNLPMEKLEKVVVRLLNPNRVAHVLGCRDTAADMAKKWGVDVTDAARAGLLHDITKALSGEHQLTLCREYGTMLDEFSMKYPKTLHALTGSLVAERIFGENKAVVSAIESHTTGKPNMNTLEKILYVADYMEPNRNFPGVEKLRELAYSDLDGALILGLEMTLDHLNEQGSALSPMSDQALRYMKETRKGK